MMRKKVMIGLTIPSFAALGHPSSLCREEIFLQDITSSLPCPLSLVPCSLFLIPCPLFLIPCPLFLVPCSLSLFPCSSVPLFNPELLRHWTFPVRYSILKKPLAGRGRNILRVNDILFFCGCGAQQKLIQGSDHTGFLGGWHFHR